ncbi:MAG: hypothetical protein ABI056_07565, partial [Caulobacteraceae bacterium]
RNNKIIRLDHSLCLRHAIIGVSSDQLAAAIPLGYVADDFQTHYFDYCGDKPLWIFSNWGDAGMKIYRHDRTGITLPCPPPTSDAEIAAYAGLDQYLSDEFSPFDYDEFEYKKTMNLVFSKVPAHGLMFVLLSETPSGRRRERNRWLGEVAAGRDNIRLVRLRNFVDDQAEIKNDKVTHFDRKVYYRLYQYMVAEAKASLAEWDRAPAV